MIVNYVYNIRLKRNLLLDIENRFSFLIVIGILIAYTSLSVGELFVDECSGFGDCYDFDRRMARLSIWNYGWIISDYRHLVHMGLIELSDVLFHNYKVLSLASSVLLLVFTFALTQKLTGNNIGGIISMVVLIQSSIFYNYDTSLVYPSFWALLFIFCIYITTTNRWYLYPIPFLISVPAKALTALFLPALFFFMWFYNKKASMIFPATLIPIALVVINELQSPNIGGVFLFDRFVLMDFLGGFVSWMWQGFANDQSTLLLLVIFGFLMFFNRKTIPHANAILSLIIGIVLTSPVLTGFTTYSIWPYRMVPLVAVIGVCVGLVIANYEKINLKMFRLGKS